MRVTKLTIHNIGIIADTVLPFDKPLILFYGEVMSGKTTILNAVRWCFGGTYPDDIIKHGATEAHTQLEGTDAGKPWCIRREWYVAKDGTTKARTITFTRNGVPVKKPVDEIAKFLNPFLLDQNHLANMNALERGRYLTELFGVDTAAEDAAIADAARRASELRIIIKAYGDIDLTPVEPVDIEALRDERASIVRDTNKARTLARESLADVMAEHERNCNAVRERNRGVEKREQERQGVQEARDNAEARIVEIDEQIKALVAEKAECKTTSEKSDKWLETHPRLMTEILPAAPDMSAIQDRIDAQADTSEIDAKIQAAGANNVRYEQYQAALKRAESRKADNSKLVALEKSQADIKATKLAKLAKIDASAKVPGLKFLDAGRFEYEGTSDGMLSDSQIMRLSAALATMYPEGFGISLIDRGESLGKSVLTLNAEATANESTILCTVVGERPARVPEHVGAWVVSKGTVVNEGRA